MVESKVTVTNPTGLHARPAAVFSKAAAQYRGTAIQVEKEGGKAADAKSLLSLLTLGVSKGTTITIRAEGPDEQAAVDALTALVTSGLGEGAK